jgi:hypothetical protein
MSKKRVWKLVGWICVAPFLVAGICWMHWTPSAGKGGIALAVGATLMPLFWERMTVAGKMTWIAMLFVLLFAEYRAIDNEHKTYAEDQKTAREEERKSFGKLLETEQAGVAKILKEQNEAVAGILSQEQQHFDKTLQNLVHSQREERAQFTKVLQSEKELFVSEQQLFPALNGQLIPANDPTPQTQCGEPSNGQYLVANGSNGFIFRQLPHTVVIQGMQHKVIWLDQKPSGALLMFIDLTAADGRVAIRLDEDGFFVNPRTNLIARRPDVSTILIQDEFAHDLMRVRFANRRVFTIAGSLIPTQAMSNVCAIGGGALGDINIH